MNHINDATKPLILIGSNSKMFFLKDICEELNVDIVGIIDSDYFGNTEHIDGIPIIDTEASFHDPEVLAKYKNNYNFFLATNWSPYKDPVAARNRQKRLKLIDLIDKFDLPCISLVDPTARVQKTTKIGKNVFIDSFVYISAHNQIEDYVSIFALTGIGVGNTVKRNSAIQRRSAIMHNTVLEQNVYFELGVSVFVSDVVFKTGTVIHPGIIMGRGTQENEVVSLVGKDLRRVYAYLNENSTLPTS